jgi:hypothetical protein
VGGVGRRFFQGAAHHLGDVVVADAPGCTGPGFIMEVLESMPCEASSPPADGADVLHNVLVFESLCCCQDDACASCQSMSGFAASCQGFEFTLFGG